MEYKSSQIEDVKLEWHVISYELKELTPFTRYECSVSAVTVDEGPQAFVQLKTFQEGNIMTCHSYYKLTLSVSRYTGSYQSLV